MPRVSQSPPNSRVDKYRNDQPTDHHNVDPARLAVQGRYGSLRGWPGTEPSAVKE